MNHTTLKQSYQEQLVRAGVPLNKAEQAAKILTLEELRMISEIWPEWANIFSQAVQFR